MVLGVLVEHFQAVPLHEAERFDLRRGAVRGEEGEDSKQLLVCQF